MIDVHILLMGTERLDFLSQCLDSLKNEPITLHTCPGIPGDIRAARANAISLGKHDYVGWVDPDDFIIPGAYSRLLNVIGDKKFAWSNEEVWDMSEDLTTVLRKSTRKTPHHMHIIHRSLIDDDFIRNKVPVRRPDSWVESLKPEGVYDNNIGYVWRRYPNSGSRTLFKEHDLEWEQRRRNHFMQLNSTINKSTNY